MTATAKLKKNELKFVAEEIGLTIKEDIERIDLKRVIEESEVFKKDNDFIKTVINQVLEEIGNQKSDQEYQIELE